MGVVLHRERVLQVPTLVRGLPAEPGTVAGFRMATQEQAALEHARSLSGLYGLTPEDMEAAQLQAVHDTGRGAVIVSFRQQVAGVEVFRNELKIAMTRELGLLAASGYLSPHGGSYDPDSPRTRFQLSAADAVGRAFEDYTGTSLPGSALQPAGEQGGHSFYVLQSAVAEVSFHEPARVKPVLYQLPKGLVPAYYVELNVGELGTPDSDFYAYVISATDGQLLFRNNLTVSDSFTYRVWADASTLIPHDGPQGSEGTPHPTGIPDQFQAPFISPNLVTLQNAPFSMNDPWLPAGATETNGNNVDAYVDLNGTDGFQTGGVDFRATTTALNTFDRVYDTALAPGASADQRMAATTQLFYVTNWLHDWFYDSGFDEASGNAQASNFGRGGLEGDSLRAEAQDYSGTNNANMSTPADGSRPRMQMYVFTQDFTRLLDILSPPAIARQDATGYAQFGAQVFDLTQDVVPVVDNVVGTGTNPSFFDGCELPWANSVAGKIALLDRGGQCGIGTRIQSAQDQGAVAVLFANSCASGQAGCNNEQLLTITGSVPTITVPVVTTRLSVATDIRTQVGAGETVSVRVRRAAGGVSRDGTLDNAIVAHEWGHYISNRLIHNSFGLGSNQARAMGEGWGDFHALLMLSRPEDGVADPTWSGTYAAAGYVMSGSGFNGPNNGYYFGIRRIPYSTDFSKNALTFKHIENGNPLPATHPVAFGQDGANNAQVHNSGEVWATALWECYVELLKLYPFAEAQQRMKDYLVAAYKMTPAFPDYIEARDALLFAAQAGSRADLDAFWRAFARRGMGVGAVPPDRWDTTHAGVVESFDLGAHIYHVTTYGADDSTRWCDRDNVLDNDESGQLTVGVYNAGSHDLTGGTLTVTGPAGVSFPAGNTLALSPVAPMEFAYFSLPISLTGAAPLSSVSLSVTFDGTNALNGPITTLRALRVQHDVVPESSTSEDFENGNFLWPRQVAGSYTFPWLGSSRGSVSAGTFSRVMWGVDSYAAADTALVSPPLQVSVTEPFGFTFLHRFQFEQDGSGAYDGGRIEISTDGGATWTAITTGVTPAYNATLVPYPGNRNPLVGAAAWSGESAGWPAYNAASVDLGTAYAGQTVQIRFRIGTDNAFGYWQYEGWFIDDVAFTGITNAPFTATVPDAAACVDRRPYADAGSDASAPERTTVTLSGASSDPDGDLLTYSWSQDPADAIAVTLQDAQTASASFVAPEVTGDTQLTFHLTVQDPGGNIDTDTVVVTITHVNRDPVVVLPAPSAADERGTAVIPAAVVSDPDQGQTVTLAWTQEASDPVQVTLTGADTVSPSFSTPEVTADTAFNFRLTATDNEGGSATGVTVVTVRHVNRAPVASAGADVSFDERTTATLSATGTDDDAGQTLSYAWTQSSGDVPQVVLTNADQATATFTAPEVTGSTALHFTVTVTDNEGGSSTDEVTVTIAHLNRDPVASAGADVSVDERTVGTLSGSASDDDAGQTLSYSWVQAGGDSVQVVLTDATSASPTFNAPEVTADTVLNFTVTVTDGEGGTASDSVAVTLRHVNRDPAIEAPSPVQVDERTSDNTVHAVASDLDQGQTLTYAWSQLGSDSLQLTLSDVATDTVRFEAPEVQTATSVNLVVTVTDNEGGTNTATFPVEIQNVNRLPQASAPADFTADERTTVTLSATGADDDTGTTLSFTWTQVSGPSVTLANADTAEASFQAPEVTADTSLVFSVISSDGEASSEPDNVTVTIRQVNRAPVAAAGADQSVASGAAVTLTGTGTDEDGDSLTYAWTQVSGPTATLSGATSASASFTAPVVEAVTTLEFELTVADGAGGTHADRVTVTVAAQVPEEPRGCGCVVGTDGSTNMAALPFALALMLGAWARRRRSA